MKKILSLFLMTLLGFAAWAADETITFSEQGYANEEEVVSVSGTDFTITFDKGTNSNAPKYYNTGTAIRLYGSNTMTVASTKKIAKIELTFGSGGGTNAITTDVGTFDTDTWTGEDKTVVFTVGGKSGHRRVASVAVTYLADGSLEAPVIDGLSPFVGSTAVSITAAEGASIFYTVDGTNPTTLSTAYTAPFLIYETTTVKAIAADATQVSHIASKTFTAISAMNSVSEFNALADGDPFAFVGTDLVAIAQSGSDLYAQDATGGMLIYGNVGQTYELGDIIPAGFSGVKSSYHGIPEVTSPTDFSPSYTTADISPLEFTIDDVTVENFGKYVVIRGATVSGTNLTVGDAVLPIRNTFASVPSDVTDKVFDVYGVSGWYDGAQFLPIKYVDVTPAPAEKHAAPIIEVDPVQETYLVGTEVTVTISSSDTDVNIGYDIEDSETFPAAYKPLANGGSFTVTADEPKTVSVRAFAYGYVNGDTKENSDVVTKTIQFVAAPLTVESMIMFKDNENDGSSALTTSNFAAQVEKGGDLVTVKAIDRVYSGKNGLKFSTSSANGSLTLTLNEPVNASSVTVYAVKYGSDVAKVAVNSAQTQDLTENMAAYTFTLDPAEELSEITIKATKRFYLKGIDIDGTVVAEKHAAPTITLDPDQETYYVGDTVTVTLASTDTDVNIGYDIEDSETFPVAYNPLTNGESFTIIADEPKTVNIRAFAYGYVEGDTKENSSVVTKTIKFVAAPITVDAMIVFKNNNVDGTAALTDENFADEIEKGSDLVTLKELDKVYSGINGLKFSTSKAGGSLTLTLAEPAKVASIKVYAVNWVNSNGRYDEGAIAIDTLEAQALTNEMAAYTFALNPEEEISEFTINATNRIYLKGIDIVKAEANIIPGDANNDGEVNALDVTLMIANILNGAELNLANADVVTDGEINASDVTAVINMILVGD